MRGVSVDRRSVHIIALRDLQPPSGRIILLVPGAYDDHSYWQHF
jgi:hypothetical protein